MTEKEFQARVVELARWLQWRVHFTWSSKHSPKGWPDLFLVRGGRAIAAELKTDTGRVSVEQRQWLDVLSEVPGVSAYLWRPKDWPEIQQILRLQPPPGQLVAETPWTHDGPTTSERAGQAGDSGFLIRASAASGQSR